MDATLVVGPKGCGKTWLLRQWAQTAHELGDLVLVVGDPEEWPEWDVNPEPEHYLDDCVLVLDEAFRPETISRFARIRAMVEGVEESGPSKVYMSSLHAADPVPVHPDEIVVLT